MNETSNWAMSDPVENASKKDCIRVSMDLPKSLIPKLERLKSDWGLQSRGSVLARLLEEILLDDEDNLES